MSSGEQDWIQGQMVLQEHDSHGAPLKWKQNDDILRRLLNNAAELWGLSCGATHSCPSRGAWRGQGHGAAWPGVPVTRGWVSLSPVGGCHCHTRLDVPVTRGWVSLSPMDDSPCHPRVAVPITTATPVPPDPCALSGQWQWVAVPCVGHLPGWCWWLQQVPAPRLLKLAPLHPPPKPFPAAWYFPSQGCLTTLI